MKNKNVKLICALLVVMGMAGYQSCRKDRGVRQDYPCNAAVHDMNTSKAVEAKILAFKEKCKFIKEHPDLKSGDLLPASEAIWLLEASLNYTYGFPAKSYESLRTESAILSLPLSSGDSLSYSNVSQCLYKMIDSLTLAYNIQFHQNNRVVVADVQRKAGGSANTITLVLSTLIGQEKNYGQILVNPFGNLDYWYFGFLQGQCDICFGQGYGSDAAKEMEKRQDLIIPPLPAGQHVFFTSIEIVNIYAHEFPNPLITNPSSNMFAYLMFCNDQQYSSTYHECLSPAEMNTHFNGWKSVIFDADKARTRLSDPSKTFIHGTLEGVYKQNQLSGAIMAEHLTHLRYGIMESTEAGSLPVNPMGK